MKRQGFFIGWFMLLALATCHGTVKTQGIASLQRGVSPELLYIDSLMWYHPDSAFWHIGHYFKPNGDNVSTISKRTEYNRHYAYLLLAELLFKNHYPQTCRENLLKTVDYFDSLTLNNDTRTGHCHCGLDPQSPNLCDNLSFLTARSHYINGVGYYEQDNVIDAYTEYIRALEIMETEFPHCRDAFNASLQPNHTPRFMMLIYCRLGSLFSDQYMQEPAIYCFQKALAFNRLESIFPDDYSRSLYSIGLQYGKQQQYDSALYYYDEALRLLPDTNDQLFRTLMSSKTNLGYGAGMAVESAVSEL